ncbi:MAG: hypothetical protein KA206_01865 [Paludibacter sp.]|nr:hypothetical protein [Paludibacter sp.]
MKKLFYLLLIPIIALSCTDDDTYESDITLINLSAKASDWKFKDQLESYYYVSFTMPEINAWVYDNAVVSVYQTFDDATQPLPVVMHNQDSEGVRWTRTIDYEYGLKTITIYVTDSDFEKDPPGNMTFKVALIW